MKKNIPLLFSLLFCLASNAQEIKTYNGTFKGGTAIYKYYENNEYERVFHGHFTYKTSNDYPSAQHYGRVFEDISITGNFKENKKDGLWESKKVFTSQAADTKYRKANFSTIVSGNYKNGIKEGIWTIKHEIVMDDKTETKSSSFNFTNNLLTGQININGASGTFDEKGNFTGSWNVNDKYYEYIAEFEKNIFTKLIVRNISDGDVLVKYNSADITPFLTDSIIVTDETRYILTDCTELKAYGGYTRLNGVLEESSKEAAFHNFYNIISKKLIDIEQALNEIPLGSENHAIIPPKVIIAREFSEYEKNAIKAKEEEEKRQAVLAKQRQEQERKLAEEKKVRELEEEKRQVELAKQRQEQERKLAEEKRIREFENSDYGKIQKSIKIEFTVWLEKGEFETQQDYEKRVKSNYQTEFDKIVQNQILKSKKYSITVLSGTLSEYDIDNQTFNVKLFGDYSRTIQTSPILINVPPNLAQNLKQKYGAEKASKGAPLLVHILDVSMINNNWAPSRLFIIFPNENRQTSSNYNQPYYDSYYWNKTQIIDNGKGKYQLAYAGNINLKAVNLKSLDTQFKNGSLDSGLFYFDWLLNDTSLNNLNFTIEGVGIILPF